MASIYDLMVTVGVDSGGVDQTLNNIGNSAGKLGSSLSSGLGNALKNVGSMLTGLASKAGDFMKSFVKMGMDYNQEMEGFTTNFATMLGDEEAAVEKVNELKKFAASTPLSMADLAQGTQTLLAFGVATEDSTDILRQLGDIALGDAEKMKRLATSFGKATASGKVSGDTVAQMIDAGWNPLLEISKETGESMEELQKRMSAGGISVDELKDAMTRATSEGGQFAGGMEKASHTTAGLISTLQDNISALAGTISGEFSESFKDVLPVAIEVIGKIQEAFEGNGEGMFSGITDGIKAFVEYVSDHLDDIGNIFSNVFSFVSEVISVAWDVILNIFNSIKSAFADVGDSLGESSISWGDVWNGIKSVVKSAGNLIGLVVQGIGKIIAWLVTESQKDGSFINLAWKTIQTAVKTCANVIEPLINMIIDLLNGDWKSAFENGKKVVSTVFNGIKTIVKDKIEFVKGLLDNIVNFFTGSGEGSWSDAFNKGKEKVSQWIEDIKEWFTSIDWIGLVSGIAVDIYNSLVDILGRAWEYISQTVSGWIENISTSISNILSGNWGGSTTQTYSAGGKTFVIDTTTGEVREYAKATSQPYLLDSATVFGRSSSGQSLVGGETQDEIIYGRNNLMNDIAQATGTSDLSRVFSGYMEQMIRIMENYFPQFSARQNIVMNSGALVAEIARDMNSELEKINGRRYY